MRVIRTEGSEERSVVRWAREHGVMALKLMRLAGFPDRVFLAEGAKIIFIEMKRSKGGRISPLQAFIHPKIRALGFRVEVCAGASEAKAVLEEWLHA